MRFKKHLSLLLIAACGLHAGCDQSVKNDGTDPWFVPYKRYKAEYEGLQGKTVAVMVDVDPTILRQHPLIQFELGESLSTKLASELKDVHLISQKDIVEYQRKNLYWNTKTYGELTKELEVERLIIVELFDYRLHEPGSVNLWRGVLGARLNIAEAEAEDPENLKYTRSITIANPTEEKPAKIKGDETTLRLAVLQEFSNEAVNLFREHKKYQR